MACLCDQLAGGHIELSPTCIGHLWIFQSLDQDEIAALNRDAFRKTAAKGQALFRQGDPADEMFLIKGGRVKLNKILENGTEVTLDIRKAGDFVGETMLAEQGLYPVGAYSMEETLTCGFTRKQFEQLILKHPNIALQIIKNLSARIAWLTTRVGSLAVTNIEDRLFRVLKGVAQEHGTAGTRGMVIQFPLTHEDLSFLIGAHRVSITRAMKALKRSGKIIHEGKKLILPSLQAP